MSAHKGSLGRDGRKRRARGLNEGTLMEWRVVRRPEPPSPWTRSLASCSASRRWPRPQTIIPSTTLVCPGRPVWVIQPAKRRPPGSVIQRCLVDFAGSVPWRLWTCMDMVRAVAVIRKVLVASSRARYGPVRCRVSCPLSPGCRRLPGAVTAAEARSPAHNVIHPSIHPSSAGPLPCRRRGGDGTFSDFHLPAEYYIACKPNRRFTSRCRGLGAG